MVNLNIWASCKNTCGFQNHFYQFDYWLPFNIILHVLYYLILKNTQEITLVTVFLYIFNIRK